GAGAKAKEIAKGPVIEVVPRLAIRLGVGRGFILPITVGSKQRLAGFLDVPENVVFRQYGRLVPEHSVGFDGQLIPGQVGRLLGNGNVQVVERILETLARQAMHQIEVEIVEASRAGHVGGAYRFVTVMDAPQCLELVGLETLHADGQAIDAQAAVVAEFGLLEGTGIGLQGDFDAVSKPDLTLQVGEDALQRLG